MTKSDFPAELTSLYKANTPDGGIIRLEVWPEGYVLWFHGAIVWKSWEPAKTVSVKLQAECSEAINTLAAAKQEASVSVYNVGDHTMARVFHPNGLTNVGDWQAVLDAVEAALTPAVQATPHPIASVVDMLAHHIVAAVEDDDMAVARACGESRRLLKSLYPDECKA